MYNIINWGDLFAFLGVLGVVVSVIQWIVVRALIAPMIACQTKELKEWAEERFISAKDFTAHQHALSIHANSRDRELESISRELGKIWRHLDPKQNG